MMIRFVHVRNVGEEVYEMDVRHVVEDLIHTDCWCGAGAPKVLHYTTEGGGEKEKVLWV